MQSNKVPLISKLAFGAGDLGTALTAGILGFFRLIFLTDVAGLPPATAGFVVMIGRIWDAVNDPLVGQWSDRLRTRWGRRRPLMLAGSLPMALGYVLMFLVPPFDITGKAIYYILASFIFDLAYTIVNVPYGALNTEMTDDYHERTSLNTFRFSFSILGSLVALITHTLIINSIKPAIQGYATAAAVLGTLAFVPYLFAFLKTYERPTNTSAEEIPVPFMKGLRLMLAHRAFVILVGIYLCAWLALQTAQTMFAYYLTYWLRIKDQLPILFVVQVSSFIGLLIWSRIAKVMGKRRTFVIGAMLWMAVMLALFFVPRDTPSMLVLILSALAGCMMSIAFLIPWAMLPDVITQDEMRTGRRREGMYYGYFALLQKLGAALALWLIGLVLETSGYISPPAGVDGVSFEQAPATLLAIRVLIGLAPLIILGAGIVLAWTFPIDQHQHEATVAELERRRAQSKTV